MKLKRIAQAALVASLSMTGVAGFAATTPDYPASVEPEVPLSQEFPKIDTYKREHHNSAVNQAPTTYPAEVPSVYSLSSEFPNIRTYEDNRMNTPVARSNTPTFPENLSPTPSMAEEGLVSGIAGEAPYANVNASNQTAVGATR